MAKVKKKKITPDEGVSPSRIKSNKNLNPFVPGQSGNPKGRPPGTGSIVHFLKRMLRQKPFKPYEKNREMKVEFQDLSEQLGFEILKRASKGKDLRALEMVIAHTEAKQITADQLKAEIDKVFSVVTKHVTNPITLAKIAKDLGLEN